MEPNLDSTRNWQERAGTSLDLDVEGVGRSGICVLRVEGEEAMSKPFRFEVLFSAEPALDVASLLGAAATLTLRRNPAVRVVTGCIDGITQGERAPSGACLYRATVVPRPARPTEARQGKSSEGETLLHVAGSVAGTEAAAILRVLRVSAPRPGGLGLVLSGESSLCTLSAGHRFVLRGHFREDLNQEYVIVKVSHRAEAFAPGDRGEGVAPAGYGCSVEAVPVSSFAAAAAPGAPRRARSTAPAGRGGAGPRVSSRGALSLPLEAHLSLNDFSEQDYPAVTSAPWARIYVPASGSPASPVGYLRLGATPTTDTTETPFQSFWPSTWPTANFNGAFLYTDTNRVLASLKSTFEYAGVSRYLKVGPATAVTAAARAESVYNPTFTTIKPAPNPGSDTTWDAPTTGLTLPAPAATYADTVTINGASKLTVNDLLVEQVLGDYVSYVHGNRYEFVAGDYKQVVSGNNAAHVKGDLTKTIYGNTTNNYVHDPAVQAGNVTVTNNYDDTVTNHYHGNADYHATYGDTVTNTYESSADVTYFGVSKTTSYVLEQRYSFGVTVGVRMGLVLDVVLGAWGSIALGPYMRFISTRFSFFEIKVDYVAAMKVDCGNIKVDGYGVVLKKRGFRAQAATVKGSKVALGLIFSPFSVITSAIVVNNAGCQLHT